MTRSFLRRRTAAALAVLAVGLVWFGCSRDQGGPTGPGLNPLDQGLRPAINVQERHTERLMAVPGVVGTAVGLDEYTRPTIKLYTTRENIPDLPSQLEGIPVQVEVTGMFLALTDPTQRQPRPVPIGVSTGHPNVTAGTIGARVRDVYGNVFLLSNNHVLADQNDANLGDPILQPGTYDGGQAPADQIATLDAFVAIDFEGGSNVVDAAIAGSTTGELGNWTPADDGYGTPSSTTVAAFVGQPVQKYGRTTGLTQGTVAEVNVTVDVCYQVMFVWCVKLARFVNQIAITPGDFSGGGDSGSLIVTSDANLNPVGLLFAGGDTRTIANPIDPVLASFGVTIDDSGTEPPPPVTDLAITSVNAPASAIEGDLVRVDVVVENIGNQDVVALFDVTLEDGATPIGAQTLSGLAAGATATVPFDWNTAGAAIGAHTLTARHTVSDDDPLNDSQSATITIEETPPPPAVIHVGDIDGGNGWTGNKWYALATVRVHDSDEGPVEGAFIEGAWTVGWKVYYSSCTTTTAGSCTMSIGNIHRRWPSVTFVVTNVIHPTATYDLAANHDPDGDSNGAIIEIAQPN